MAKYTTEVRSVCEVNAGLTESVGFDKVDYVLEKSWGKIFTSTVRFFDEEYRSVLCQKILKRYYTKEIGCESVGLWKLWMNERLETIMPYYNQLYESELLKFEPLNDVDVTREYKRKNDAETKQFGEHSDKTDGETTTHGSVTRNDETYSDRERETSHDNTSKDKYSDTPQGTISDLEGDRYLTNARIVNDDGVTTDNEHATTTTNSTGTSTDNGTSATTNHGTNANNENRNSTEDYLETVVGKHGGGTFSAMLNEFRTTFLNIDNMVINEFQDLFMGLW